MGIHNEAGLHELNPMPSVDDLISDMLKYCLDPNDKDRAFVEFKPNDTVLLLINNFGGLSNLETEALTASTRRLLKKNWDITPERHYVSAFETSLNAPGWSLSLLNVSGIERTTKTPVKDLLKLLDAETTAPAWPRNGYRQANEVPQASDNDTDTKAADASQGPTVYATSVEAALRQACNAAIASEPDLTKWDIEMGDGDCGEAVVGMCQGILRKLDAGLCKSGKIFHILDEIDEAVEEIGGTLGAIIAIIVASYATNLRQAAAAAGSGFAVDEKVAGAAAGQALRNLMGYTSARKGGRTVMDTLIPFCETFEKDGFAKAVQAAEQGAESTAGMKAKFGRGEFDNQTTTLETQNIITDNINSNIRGRPWRWRNTRPRSKGRSILPDGISSRSFWQSVIGQRHDSLLLINANNDLTFPKLLRSSNRVQTFLLQVRNARFLHTPTAIHRHVNTSQESRLLARQESTGVTDVFWRAASSERHGGHERLLVLRLAKEEIRPVMRKSSSQRTRLSSVRRPANINQKKKGGQLTIPSPAQQQDKHC